MTTEIVLEEIPEAMGDEYGDHYYAQGHLDPATFALAVIIDLAQNCGDSDALDLLGEKDVRGWRNGLRESANRFLASVRHVYFIQDPLDDEKMNLCGPNDEGAQPWTMVDL